MDKEAILTNLKKMLMLLIKGRDCMRDLVDEDTINMTNALFTTVYVHGEEMDNETLCGFAKTTKLICKKLLKDVETHV